MPTFLLEALTASVMSVYINIDYQPSTTQDEIVIVAETNSNKLFKFSNYI